jgi:hypothetical protein
MHSGSRVGPVVNAWRASGSSTAVATAESQLPGEAAPLADRHVHPAEPRTVRLTLRVGF